MIQRSRASGHYFFYPRIAVPGTGETDIEWVCPSGAGAIYAVTVIRKKDPVESYNIVLVELAEGPRLMSTVEGIDHDAIKIGMRVQAQVKTDGPEPKLVFVPS